MGHYFLDILYIKCSLWVASPSSPKWILLGHTVVKRIFKTKCVSIITLWYDLKSTNVQQCLKFERTFFPVPYTGKQLTKSRTVVFDVQARCSRPY